MSFRGFNRRYQGRNSWRGGYRAKSKSFRGKGSRNNLPQSSPYSNIVSENDLINIQPKATDPPVVYNLNKVVRSAYSGWKLYFPNDEYKTSAAIVRKVKVTEEFIARHADLFNEEEIDERRSCIFDLKICLADEEFIENWSTFKDDLFNMPCETLSCLGLAVHQTVWKLMKEQSCVTDAKETDLIEVPKINAHVINYDSVIQLKNLKTNYYGKLVAVTGTAIRVSNVKLQCSWLAFQCVSCRTVQCVKQVENVFTQPKQCFNKDCHYRTFKPLRNSSYTQTYDWQTVRLQEQVPDDQREGGRVPRTIECELTEGLVSSCSPGDVLNITGIVKVRSVEQSFKKTKGPSMFTLYLEVVSVVNNKSSDCAGSSTKDSDSAVQFTQKDYDAIQEIHAESDLFKLLVHSLCPAIYGHEMVKSGLLLALFGGSFGDSMDTRGQAHVLIVGDPGLGKSQMLQACSFIAPRGVFVCGNTTTSSGLTVTLTRAGSGDFALEAGALVLADQGCCCIDEFDKMSTQHQALLEVMEQQTVSIAKAGVICMLPARTTVLAAANPAGGHYNKSKTVSENLRMGQALLSRFDLVFILLDKPDERLDCLLSEHVMRMHSGLSEKPVNVSFEQEPMHRNSLENKEILLSERLKRKPTDNLNIIPSQLLRKYIAYAQKYIPQVTLNEDARKALQTFYLKLRENHHTLDSTPVTTRQLLSLIRLTQARAKLELREKANLSDALEVMDIVQWSLIDTYSDEFGTLDFRRSQHGSGMSSKSQAKRFLTALHRKSEALSRSTFTVAEMKEIAKSIKIDVGNFSSFISTLNIQGFILKKGKETYQVLSAD